MKYGPFAATFEMPSCTDIISGNKKIFTIYNQGTLKQNISLFQSWKISQQMNNNSRNEYK